MIALTGISHSCSPKSNAPDDVAIIVPILNAGGLSLSLLGCLRQQGVDLSKVYVVDSASTDGSVEILRNAGCVVHTISRGDFDHGGTRNLGLELSGNSEVVVFLTQDALLEGRDVLRDLLAPFSNPKVGLAYGRQLPRDGAAEIESHARHFNYPAASTDRTMADARRLGIKAIFNSNSFAAYRRRALADVGGFPTQTILGEDQIVAAKMLLKGWTISYAANACVKHSHGYSIKQEFRRYFDIGVFHREELKLLEPFQKSGSEGLRYIRSEFWFLLNNAPHRIPEAAVRTASKLLGYKLGSWHRRLPSSAIKLLAWNKPFFLSRSNKVGINLKN